MKASTNRDQVSTGASHIRARDLMSRHVVAVGADVSINDAIKIMLTQHISGLPVLDPQGKLVGIVSEGDFLRRAEVGTDKKEAAGSPCSPVPTRLRSISHASMAAGSVRSCPPLQLRSMRIRRSSRSSA